MRGKALIFWLLGTLIFVGLTGVSYAAVKSSAPKCDALWARTTARFEKIQAGETRRAVIAAVGKPTRIKSRFSKYADSIAPKCKGICAQRLWYIPKGNCSASVWYIDLGKDHKVVTVANMILSKDKHSGKSGDTTPN